MDNLCLTCVKCFDIALDSIFLVSRFDLKFADMIKECTCINITTMDQFPKQICIDCQIKLEASYSFIKQCQESAIKLEEIIKTNDVVDAIEIKHEQIDSFEDNSVDIEDNSVDNHEELRKKSVNQKKSLECKRCPMQFHNQELLADHLNSHSNDPTPAKCHLCGKGFQHKRSIKRHLINIHKTVFEDNNEDLTNFAFTSTFKIANETNLSHNLVPGECNRCYKPFKDEELLVEHIKSHDGDSKPFECYICRTGFQHKRSLKCHLIKLHPTSHTFKIDESNPLEIVDKNELDNSSLEVFDDNNEDLDNSEVLDSFEKDVKKPTDQLKIADIEYYKTELEDIDEDDKTPLSKYIHQIDSSQNRDSKPSTSIAFKKKTKNKFKCKECEMMFAGKDSLKKHLTEEHPSVLYKCEYCDKMFILIGNLNGHTRKYHKKRNYYYHQHLTSIERVTEDGQNGQIVCERCLSKCDSKEDLAEHLQTHLTDPMPFKCNICDQGFYWQSRFLAHYKSHDVYNQTSGRNQPENECKRCCKPFENVELIPEHLKSHADDLTPFVCYVCGKGMANKTVLTKHIMDGRHFLEKGQENNEAIPTKEDTSKLQYICEICGQCFNNQIRLLTHTRGHKYIKTRNMIFIADGTKRLTRCKEDASKKLLVLESFKCFICQEIFNNSKLLHEHLKSVHNHERFWCEQCNTFYESKELLEEHITKSHELTCKRCLLKCDSVDSYIEHVPIHDDDPLPFKCRFCGRGIKYAYYLKEHTNMHIGVKVNICQWCGRAFNNYSNLKSHMRTHTDERPFSCKICNKSFRNWHSLRSHERTHNSARPFSCEKCGAAFKQKGALRGHMQIHLGLSKKPCHLCGKSISKSLMKRHLQCHSGEKKHVCEVCDMAFRRRDNLKVHMKTHTG